MESTESWEGTAIMKAPARPTNRAVTAIGAGVAPLRARHRRYDARVIREPT